MLLHTFSYDEFLLHFRRRLLTLLLSFHNDGFFFSALMWLLSPPQPLMLWWISRYALHGRAYYYAVTCLHTQTIFIIQTYTGAPAIVAAPHGLLPRAIFELSRYFSADYDYHFYFCSLWCRLPFLSFRRRPLAPADCYGRWFPLRHFRGLFHARRTAFPPRWFRYRASAFFHFITDFIR